MILTIKSRVCRSYNYYVQKFLSYFEIVLKFYKCKTLIKPRTIEIRHTSASECQTCSQSPELQPQGWRVGSSLAVAGSHSVPSGRLSYALVLWDMA